MTDEITYVSATGMLGAGYAESSLFAARTRSPAFIGCDAGSTDGGPSRLGAGLPVFGEQACRRDLTLALRLAGELGIPLLVGSCQGAGLDSGVDEVGEMVRQIAKSEGLRFRVARIYAEIDRELIKQRLAEGRVHALSAAPPIDADVVDRSSHVVAMMGIEPYQRALDAGADVVLAGRSSDTSIYSAIPVAQGFAPGLVWHAAKIMECGVAAAANWRTQDSMLCTIRPDHFVVEPLDPQVRCTPLSVAAHALYENGNPYRLVEPSGTLDTTASLYDDLDGRAVKVSGSEFVPAKTYTLKLEGAVLAGYQSFTLGSMRDPVILRQLDSWVEGVQEATAKRIASGYGLEVGIDYQYRLRVYGKNGTLGECEPTPGFDGHEAFLYIDVLAPTPELANDLILAAKHVALHYPVPEWSGSITAFAHPLTPGCINQGPVYRFNMNHVVEVDDPCDPYRFEYEEVS